MADELATMLAGGNPALAGFIAAFLVFIIIIAIAAYIYGALALMAIAKRTNTPNAWLAWIPIANVYLMTQIGKTPWWTIFGLILVFIPFIGSLIVAGLTIYWWWFISKARSKPEWWGILMIIPIVNWVMMGIMAWGE